MKKSYYKQGIFLIITLFLTSFTLSADEVTKEYHKEYTAGTNTTLEIINKYGDVVIQSWESDEVVIDVKVTVELPNRERAERLLSYINVDFSEGTNYISAETEIDNRFNFSGWSNSRRFSIDYNVKMPASTALTLSNKYGNTDIDELDGLVELDIKYGNLTAGKLNRGNEKPINTLNIAYGKAMIDEAKWLDITARYSGSLEITTSQAILIDSKYSKLSFDETSSVVGESKYDNIRIGTINNLVMDNGYTETNIDLLTKKLDYEGGYGSLSVDHVPAGFESIFIDTRYIGIKLGIEESADYELEAELKYGSLKYNEDDFNVHRRIIENNSTEVEGTVGNNESPGSRINIISSYGSVRLN
jgi:hypothetical protein